MLTPVWHPPQAQRAQITKASRVPAPISVIHIHGTADQYIPYDGGAGEGSGRIDGPAIPALNATWRAIDHCAAPMIKTTAPVTTSTAACPANRTVELITHPLKPT